MKPTVTTDDLKQVIKKFDDKSIGNKVRFVVGTIIGKALNESERMRIVGFLNDDSEQMFSVQRIGFGNVVKSDSIYGDYRDAFEHYRGARK